MDTPKYVQLGEGVYADPSDEHIMVINPVEMLKFQGIEVTQESVFAVYADALKGADEEGIEVILITEEGIPSTAELIGEYVTRTTQDEDGAYAGDSPEGESTEEVDITSAEEVFELQETDNDPTEESGTIVMITSDEYTGPERRRIPRK